MKILYDVLYLNFERRGRVFFNKLRYKERTFYGHVNAESE